MNYIIDRLAEAGSYRSLMISMIPATQLAVIGGEQGLALILAGISGIFGFISFMMKEKKDVTVKVDDGTRATTIIKE